ncbi:hypothetical protein N9181_00745 [bacterium]|nr:hypothetical protein [bacterium]
MTRSKLPKKDSDPSNRANNVRRARPAAVNHTDRTNAIRSVKAGASTEADWMMRFGVSVVYNSAPNR